MSLDTEAIDKLFLELSQFTNATTARELELIERIRKLEQRHPAPVPVAPRYEFSVYDADYVEQAGGIAPTYAQALSEGQHYLAQYQQDGPHTLELRRVEVLNPNALPPPAEGEVGELVGRLGWIAAQLGDIGWHDDAADVARAAAIISQRHPAPVPVAERPPLPCELDGDGFCYLGVLETDPLLGEPRFSCWDYEESRKRLNDRFTHFLPWNTPSLPAHALPLPAEEMQP